MRPHGRAQVSQTAPRALAVCDGCGFMFNLDDLQWQWDWLQGPRLFNKRILVCRTCLDVPQESGRTIVLPPDPIPVANPRPEAYALADNPVSGLGLNMESLNQASSTSLFSPASNLGENFGTIFNGFGVDSVFYITGQSSTFSSTSVTALFAPRTAPLINKRFGACANRTVSISSFQNTIGKNWNALPSNVTLTLPSTVAPVAHVVSQFTAYSPNDRPFLGSAAPNATGFLFQGSADSITWTTISSGQTAGTTGETLTVNTTLGAAYQYHRFVLQGDGVSSVGVAGLSIAISDAAPNDI